MSNTAWHLTSESEPTQDGNSASQMTFSITSARAFEVYRLPDGRLFEFRYVANMDLGVIFVIFNNMEAYLTPDQYSEAVLCPGMVFLPLD